MPIIKELGEALLDTNYKIQFVFNNLTFDSSIKDLLFFPQYQFYY